MAREIKIILIDDVDGGPADQTLVFGWKEEMLEIDLSNDNASKLRDAIMPFVVKARRHEVQPKAKGKPKQSGGMKGMPKNTVYLKQKENRLIREWATSNGYNPPERGRIPEEIRDAYYQHAGPHDRLTAHETEVLHGSQPQLELQPAS